MSVSKQNNKQRSYLQTIRLPVLISTAITIMALCFMIFFWHQEAHNHQTQEFSQHYNQGMADLSAAFLGHLIEDENTDAIESIGQRVASNDNIQQVAIYRRNGELVFSAGNTDQAHSDPVIANIAYEDSYNGYLVIYFVDAEHFTNSEQPLWFNSYVLWLFGGILWLIIFLLLNIKRGRSRQSKAQNNADTSSESATQHNGQLLKELIKRNRQQLQNKSIKHSLVIKADWSKLTVKDNTQLLRTLSRWLPQNAMLATQFNHGLLVLGLDGDKGPLSRNALHALERCFQHIQLEPKILLHRLNFDRDIYQMFFGIIEPGVWYEKALQEKDSDYNWPAKKVIDIELDNHDIIELCRLEEPDAEQRGLIERQVRFLSDD